MKHVLPSEWRTQSRRKRRFYAGYMKWLERAGYVLVAGVLGAFVVAFRYPVDDLVTADKVAIEPFSTPVTAASAPVRVVRWLVEDFTEVQEGQPVAEYFGSEDAVAGYERWRAVDALRTQVGETAEVRALTARFPKPEVSVFRAPSAGTFRQNPNEGGTFEEDASVGRVVDYRDLRMTASLAGDTVPRAKVGQSARVTAINVDSGTGTLLRATADGRSVVSGRLLGESVRTSLEESLKDAPVRLRDDVPLKVTGVSEVQVDATATGSETGESAPLLADPAIDFALSAQVVEGTSVASVQTTDLPAPAAAQAEAAIRAAMQGKTLTRPDGRTVSLGKVADARFIVKLKAESGQGIGTPINATKLTRTFDAKLKIDSPPLFLVEAVRNADRLGKPVTARVELRTGTRPIAFILLKKS